MSGYLIASCWFAARHLGTLTTCVRCRFLGARTLSSTASIRYSGSIHFSVREPRVCHTFFFQACTFHLFCGITSAEPKGEAGVASQSICCHVSRLNCRGVHFAIFFWVAANRSELVVHRVYCRCIVLIAHVCVSTGFHE